MSKKILKKIEQNGGIILAKQARLAGIHSRDLTKLVKEKLLIKEGVGIYRLTELDLNEHSEIAILSAKYPRAIVCLISALAFHGMTTQIPKQIDIALPFDGSRKKPKLENAKSKVHWFSNDAYSEGIEKHIMHGIKVKIYSKEKTLADCFKFRNKIGLDIALEALDIWSKQRGRNISELTRFAKICRVANILKPYLEVKLG
jgi:predicted transcriptional regulator of viral defense system